MKEIIGKYIRKHCQIKGNAITLPARSRERFNLMVSDIFGCSFSINDWLSANIDFKYNISYSTGTVAYFEFGELHRGNDQPAVIHYDDIFEWFKNGKRHRDGGPAIITEDGDYRYFIMDKEYSKRQFDARTNR